MAELPFDTLTPHLGVGAPAPAGWQPIATAPLLILVGVTGVGKSTVLAKLAAAGIDYLLLPDRRDLTDRLIIAAIQAADGLPPGPVSDRKLRFEYTRRYRAANPGGMAHALTQLVVDPAAAGRLLIFDGLRGANEVEAAAAALPRARFAMLDAPDAVRVRRLLNRGDAFDRIAPTAAPTGSAGFADLGVPDAAALFTPAEEQTLLGWVAAGEVTAADLRAKLQIVVEERRNYDPAATHQSLDACAPDRTLYLDTVALTAGEVAARLAAWLG